MNIIIISEHRVGSRWLHYLLAELYDMNTSPEIDAKRLEDKDTIKEIKNLFKQNKIVKFHHALPYQIFEKIEPVNYKVIGVVRNPRDRAVSFAFHNRYHKGNYPFPQKECESDGEAVRFTVMEDEAFLKNTERQFLLMDLGFSTKKFTHRGGKYLWTSYEWMKNNTIEEIMKINSFLESETPLAIQSNVVRKHSFKSRAKGREAGKEVRKNIWRRKGIVGDYLNWFSNEMMKATLEDNNKYWEILEEEGGELDWQ